jgi:hypothetical protein
MFRRKHGPVPDVLVPEVPAGVTALEFLAARRMPDMTGTWVYALCDAADGRVFYAGQTANFYSRMRDHSYAFKDRFDPGQMYVVPCEDQAEADLYELLLIRRYDPECNTVGRRGELEGRLRTNGRPFKPGHHHSPKPGYLDSRQETV